MKKQAKLKLMQPAPVVQFDHLKSIHEARGAAFMITLYVTDGGTAMAGEFALCETKDRKGLTLVYAFQDCPVEDHVAIDRTRFPNAGFYIGRVVSIAYEPYNFTQKGVPGDENKQTR